MKFHGDIQFVKYNGISSFNGYGECVLIYQRMIAREIRESVVYCYAFLKDKQVNTNKRSL